MKKFAVMCLSLLTAALPLAAQDAAALSEILEKREATVTDLSYLAASQLGMECTPFEAYAYCDRFGTFPLDSTAELPVTVRLVSYFLMKNYGLKGGLMWTATGNPRYAWKELKAQGFWKPGTDPDNILSGRDLVRAISKFSDLWPDAMLLNPPVGEASNEYREAILAAKEDQK